MAVHLTSISATFFTNLLSRLGVKPPPPDGFDLINTVQPVSLVDSDIALSVTSATQIIDTPFTAGEVNPTANQRLFDSLPQSQGTYLAFAIINFGNANSGRLRRRNSSDTADIWSQRINATNTTTPVILSLHLQLQTNERLVFEVITADVSFFYQANLWLIAG
jgi:hypothetical protein